MDTLKLERLLEDLEESDRVERKPNSRQGKEIRQTICAFANDLPGHGKPGVIFIGLQNDGSCAGIKVHDQLLQELSNIRGEGTILPVPVITVQKHRIKNCDLAVILVQSSSAPPVRYKGRVYVRVGPTTREATPEEERRLAERRRAKDLPFDLRPVPSASLDDLDLDLLRRVYLPSAIAPDLLVANQRSLEEQVASIRFATTDTPPQPTVLGILVAGKDPRDFVPGDYIQFLRIAGTTLTDPIKDSKEIDSPLPDLLRQLDELLEVHISVAVDVTSTHQEVRQIDYPIVALQQLARNAVMHRDYEGTHAPVRITWFDDRIEIQNPGGPYGQVTRENFGRPGVTDYRNPHLAEAMKNLGYVQRFGLGIPLAREELRKNGNPEVEFVAEDAFILAVVRRRP